MNNGHYRPSEETTMYVDVMSTTDDYGAVSWSASSDGEFIGAGQADCIRDAIAALEICVDSMVEGKSVVCNWH